MASELLPQINRSSGGSVLVLVLHFGSENDTAECLRSFAEVTERNFEIAVIDNDPAHRLTDGFKAEFRETTIIETSGNLGFAAANNLGLRYALAAGFEFSLLLNNDTTVEPDFLAVLCRAMTADASIALAGPAMYYYNNKERLWSCGGWINRWSASMAGEKRLDRLRSDIADVDYLPGACILVRNNSLSKIGLMSEDYFLGVEEADWAISARNCGFRVIACARSVVLHKVGVSSRFAPELIYNSFRNRFLFLRRQFRLPWRILLIGGLLIRKLLTDRSNRSLCLRAFVDHCRHGAIRRSHLEKIKADYAIAR